VILQREVVLHDRADYAVDMRLELPLIRAVPRAADDEEDERHREEDRPAADAAAAAAADAASRELTLPPVLLQGVPFDARARVPAGTRDASLVAPAVVAALEALRRG
jgi:hypothetical protein